ncbi:acetyl-CoA carboxylase biotin carboxyl carrier protein [Paraburkholderia bannensis]|uniref:acetyl-CoA carboxylase biotin carboxyl carrier protein n=1 Tax=Paraburkholderia bannensis TaxID=765414 RepID=UPI002AC3549C|nr:biotin/lipoyl-containing protein [Paraburkholderia bannensis]
MDLEKIKALIDLLAESPLAKLEVIEGDERVKLIKTKGRRSRREPVAADHDASHARRADIADMAGIAGDQAALSPQASAAPAASQPTSQAALPAKAQTQTQTQQVLAPMAGVAHLKPAPDESPFVAVGDSVADGQVLCTIEAMKMFIAVESMHEGVVAEILVESGTEVAAGQPLFRIG